MQANKTRFHHFLETWALGTSGESPVMFSTKVNLLHLLYLTARPEVWSSASDKAKLFLKTFLRTLILMTWVSRYLFSFL